MEKSKVVFSGSATEDALIAQVIRLADQNRKTLGMFPRGAFKELAERGQLVVAVDSSQNLLGYVLFDQPKTRPRIRIIHLCLSPEARGKGIAENLIHALREKFQYLQGISLKCRKDYEYANALWRRLGFIPRNEKEGRGKTPSKLVYWWLPHGMPDLFEPVDESKIRVAIDHNIFIDLAVERDREGAEESAVLISDYLEDEVELAVTAESFSEIQQISNDELREAQRNMIAGFKQLNSDSAVFDEYWDRWKAAVGVIPPADEVDCRHIVRTAAGDASVFVTRDRRLIEKYGDKALELFGVEVLEPYRLVSRLDEIQRSNQYNQVELHRTKFTQARFGNANIRDLQNFLAPGEKLPALTRVGRAVLGEVGSTSSFIYGPKGELLAAWAANPKPATNTLEVTLIRVRAKSTLASTLVKQIAMKLRQVALEENLSRVMVDGNFLSTEVAAVLSLDGYAPAQEGGLEVFVVDRSGTRGLKEELTHFTGTSEYARKLITALDQSTKGIQGVLSYELNLWPVKLFDTDLPNFMVPIKPKWALDLLNYGPSLFERDDLLGISREHVYFRSVNGNPDTPGRLLWYVSSGPANTGMVACGVSHLIEVTEGSPDALYSRYKRLGVYRRQNIRDAATAESVAALRFVNTELFTNPVPWSRIKEIGGSEFRGTPQGLRKIPSKMFESIYREGTGRGE